MLAAGGDRLWALSRDGSDRRTVAALDPRSGRLGRSVAIRGAVPALAAGDGAAWVLDRPGFGLTRVDARTARDRRAMDPPAAPDGLFGLSTVGLAVGAGGVWVLEENHRRVVRADARTGREKSTL
ncbi:MAG: hypothetical protein ACR2LK_00205 [Solirubrobacteraceae bacterium]